jgi:hypothetical protein
VTTADGGRKLTQGLDLRSPDTITDEEITAFHAEYERTNKGCLASFEFWIEFRPDVLKRHKARTPHYFGIDAIAHPLSLQLAAIHRYTIERFADGIAYEIRLAQSNGALRTDILDTLSIAWLHAGHGGMYAAAAAATEHLRGYQDPAQDRFPANWSFDPHAFECGIDYSSPVLTAEDLECLTVWYEQAIGFVPRNVSFLAKHRPGLLKSNRDRYEHAIRDSLPAQMLPYLLLGHAVCEQRIEGIRENFLLGRNLGMTDVQLLDPIMLAVLFAGVETLDAADVAIGDLIDVR